MARPSRAAVAWIRTQAPDWSRTAADIAATLNADQVPNPGPRPTRARPFTLGDLRVALEPATMVRISLHPHADVIFDRIEQQDRPKIRLWLDSLRGVDPTAEDPGPILGAAEYARVDAVLSALEPDPTWPETLPRTLVELGRILDPADIESARPE